MHIGKKVWRSYDDSRSQSSTELNSLNKFIIIIISEKKTCEIDAGALMGRKKNKIILFVYHQDILLYLSMISEEQCVSTVGSLA